MTSRILSRTLFASRVKRKIDMTDIHYRNADGLNSTPVSAANPLPIAPGLSPAQLSAAKLDNAAAAGDYTAIAGVLGQTAKVYRLFLVAAGATNLTVKDGATALTGA